MALHTSLLVFQWIHSHKVKGHKQSATRTCRIYQWRLLMER